MSGWTRLCDEDGKRVFILENGRGDGTSLVSCKSTA
jgi:hypothetical protein